MSELFNLAVQLARDHGKQTLESLNKAEKNMVPTLYRCEGCKDFFDPDQMVYNWSGLSFCSEECRDKPEEETDNTCHVCRGTGEGQNDYCSCYNCNGKGYVYPKGDMEP